METEQSSDESLETLLARLEVLVALPDRQFEAAETAAAALSLVSREHNPELWASILALRSDGLHVVGAARGDADMLRGAVTGFDEALDCLSRFAAATNQTVTHQRRGDALQALGALETDPALIERAVASYDAALDAFAVHPEDNDRTEIDQARANALQALGTLLGDPAPLRAAVAGYDLVIGSRTKEAAPSEWAVAQTERAIALKKLGSLSDDPALIREAIAGYDAALSVRSREDGPEDWALTQQNRGIALGTLGDLIADPSLHRAALASYDAVQAVRTRDRDPAAWAMTEHSRAIALRGLAEFTGDIEGLRAALASYDAVLEVRTRDGDPVSWAGTQQNRAGTLFAFGERAGDPALFRDAIAAYDAALEVRTRASNPASWAMTQYNRAKALERLGEMTGDTALLRAALEGFDAALEVRTEAAAPAHWASTVQARADAMRTVGGFLGDPEMLLQAVESYDTVLGSYAQAEKSRRWANAHLNRSNTVVALADLNSDPVGLEEAIAGYDHALTVFEKASMPASWMLAVANKASALYSLGNLTFDPATLRAAIDGHDEVLSEIDRGTAPAHWADAQQNKGNALHSCGALLGDADLVAQAAAAYRAALLVRTRVESPARWAMLQQNLAVALEDQAGLTGDVDLIEEALAARRLALEVMTMEAHPDQSMALSAGLVAMLFVEGDFEESRDRLDVALRGSLRHILSLSNRAARERAIQLAAGLSELRAWIAIALDHDGSGALDWLEQGRARLLGIALAKDRAAPGAGPPIAELLRAIPQDGAAVLPIITPAGAKVAVVRGGATSVEAEDFIDLPDLTRNRVEEWFFGPFDDPAIGGYTSAYDEGRLRWGEPTSTPGSVDSRFPDVLRTTLDQVWHHLLGPVDHRLSELGLAAGAPVILMPPGLLSLLPLWAAGPSAGPDGGDEPFGARWTVSHVPSLTALHAVRHREATWQALGASVTALAVLDPATDAQIRLGAATLEGELLARKLGGDRLSELTDADATAQAVRSGLVGKTHLHLAAHGAYSPNLPDRSAVLLAGDDRLTLGELRERDASNGLRLVVLSACDTALPGLQAGRIDEFIGLPTGFLQAGAAAVIASHWPVRSDATFFLMWKFYDTYLDDAGHAHTTPARALQSASLWLRNLTVAELAGAFEPFRDDEGVPVPGAIDRSRPTRTRYRAHPAATDAAVNYSQSDPPPVLTIAQRRAILAHPAAYMLPRDASDEVGHKPFANPVFWAAFSITGV
ncbi:MAG: CHAT domain-containing protein [Pseudomonadota bacterium]